MTDASASPIAPRLDAEALARIAPFAERRAITPGDVLFAEGEQRIPWIVILSGAVEVRHSLLDGSERLIRRLGPCEFLGDVAILTGQSAVARAVAVEAGEILRVPFEALQRLLADDSALSDIVVATVILRRQLLRDGAASAISLIGRRYDRHAFELRELLTRNGAPFAWIDADDAGDIGPILAARGLTREDLPVLVDGRGALARPGLCDVAERLGLSLVEDGAEADVIVVGAGPGGLAAAVYAASEGLSVIALDASGPGGQAGTSSKIENYLGFPTGVSGRELAERASVQAQKFGAVIAAPASAQSLAREGEVYRLALQDGRTLRGRAVVIATGAHYRKPDLADLEMFEGSGVYYGATPMEAQLCGGQEIAVVGAGNSAGQGAVFLAAHARVVHVLFRRGDLRETMSDYLVRRLEALPNVRLWPRTELSALKGCEKRLRRIVVEGPDGPQTLETPFVFLFIGAEPCTAWLPPVIATDAKGFLVTGPALAPRDLVRAGWDLERMPGPLETNWPRVYAVGDVRAGSVKRVASSVGEGSVVVSDIHKALAEIRAVEAA